MRTKNTPLPKGYVIFSDVSFVPYEEYYKLEERCLSTEDLLRSEKNLTANMREANAALIERETLLKARNDNQFALIESQNAELANLKAELAKWRPPAAKFHAGQVLVKISREIGKHDFAVKIQSTHFLHYSNAWSYLDTCGRAWTESDLRTLTDEEK